MRTSEDGMPAGSSSDAPWPSATAATQTSAPAAAPASNASASAASVGAPGKRGAAPGGGPPGFCKEASNGAPMPYVRTILTDKHPTLRKVAKRVERSEIADPLFQQLIDDMFVTMFDAPGIGLAAPQIDVSQRVFVVDLQDDDPGHGPLVVINPKFSDLEGEVEAVEGCLSVPGYVGEVTRYERVVCTGLDRRGRKITLEG